jgi:hypothetical protein
MATSGTDSIRVSPVPPELVNAVWLDVLPFLVDALDVSDNEVTIAHAHQQCLHSQWDLWVTTRGEDLVGFVMLEPLWSAKGMWVNIVYAGYGKDLEAVNATMARIEEVARSCGSHGVKYISSDRRFGSFAKRKGYRERYREYVKEF